jgi:hypothetical protein
MHPELTLRLASERVRELGERAARGHGSGLGRPGRPASLAATVAPPARPAGAQAAAVELVPDGTSDYHNDGGEPQ